MKTKVQKIITIVQSLILFLCFLSFGPLSHAATPSATPPPTAIQDKLIDQINDLKEKIASKVASLKLVDKRAVVGTVVGSSSTQITINDLQDQTRFIDVDEITKFTGTNSSETFGISDLSKGMHISVLGLYNKESRRITARFINVITPSRFVSGTVLSVDRDAARFKVISEGGKQTTIDVENVTNTSTYTKDDGIVKSGFSKLAQGDRVIVSGYTDKNDTALIISTRIVIFSDLPKNPNIIIPDGGIIDNSDEPITSTGSGKRLTPIR